MKPYGLSIEEGSNFYDVKFQGRKSSLGTRKGKGGDYRGCHKNKAAKARVRRYYKRKARNNWKQEAEGQLVDDEALREELEVEEREYREYTKAYLLMIMDEYDEFYKGLNDEWYDTFDNIDDD